MMRDVAASGAAIALSVLALRVCLYTAVLLLCLRAQKRGQTFEGRVGWSLALAVKTEGPNRHGAQYAPTSVPVNRTQLPIARKRQESRTRSAGLGDLQP